MVTTIQFVSEGVSDRDGGGIGKNDSGAVRDRIGLRFRLPSVDRRHPSSVGMGMPSSAPPCLPQRHYRELMKRGSRMLTIIKASLLGSALMLLESCSGYLTNYQTPCVEGHVCECVQYTTVYRSWLDCRDYGRVKSKAY